MTITEDPIKRDISVSRPLCPEYPGGRHQEQENKDTYADYANLVGKTVAVRGASAAQSVAEEDENLSQSNLVTVSKQTDALLEVKSGTADAGYDRPHGGKHDRRGCRLRGPDHLRRIHESSMASASATEATCANKSMRSWLH